MRNACIVLWLILSWVQRSKATSDYHQVIDQLAKALSTRAQSVRNVTSFLNNVLDSKDHSNNSYHLPSSSYRPSANGYHNSSSIIPTDKATLRERVTVPSQRLLNDILVVRSSRRLYVLVLMPIHESLNSNGYECGQIDVNAMIRLGAFLSALDDVNLVVLEPDLSLGAIVIDTCTSDLRTLANLYELFTGTNIEKSDIVAVVLDDESYSPITDKYLYHLELPLIRTTFPKQKEPMSISTLPHIVQPIEAMMDLLQHTQSNCISVVHDESYADFVTGLSDLAFERYMCIDRVVNSTSTDGVSGQQQVVRQLLVSEARVVLVLYSQRSWLDFIMALSEEMVISGRFIFVTLQLERWKTSKAYSDTWQKFEQLLISVAYKNHHNITYLNKLNSDFPRLPFPVQWLRQFWTTAFKCHFVDDQFFGEQFSRVCPTQQELDLSTISPDMKVAPISFAVYSVAQSLRRLVEHNCPGALVRSLDDCLSSGQYQKLLELLKTSSFSHPLARKNQFSMNGTDGFAKAELVLNKVYINQGALINEELGVWDSEGGLTYADKNKLFVEDRDGSRVQVISQCPTSSCWGVSAVKRTSKHTPSFIESLFKMDTLMFSGVSTLWTFVCLMCTYQKVVSSTSDPFWACSSISFVGAALTALTSILFVMAPSEPTCMLRLTLYSSSLMFVAAPIFVRVLASWNFHIISLKGEVVGNNRPLSPTSQFWISMMLIIVQLLLLVQWSFFDDLQSLNFSQYDSQFSWRCLGGQQTEFVLARSCAYLGFMCLIMFVCSTLRCTNRDFHASALAINTFVVNLVLYYVSPQLNFVFRDYLVTAILLWYSVLTVFTTYCLSPRYPIIELATTSISNGTLDNKRGTLLRKTQLAQEHQQRAASNSSRVGTLNLNPSVSNI